MDKHPFKWFKITGNLQVDLHQIIYLLITDINNKIFKILLPLNKTGKVNYVFNCNISIDNIALITNNNEYIEQNDSIQIKEISIIQRYLQFYITCFFTYFAKNIYAKNLKKRIGLSLFKILFSPQRTYQNIITQRLYDRYNLVSYNYFKQELDTIIAKEKYLVFKYRPRITIFIITPCINTDTINTIKSINNQTYTNFQIEYLSPHTKIFNTDKSDYFCFIYAGDILPYYAFYYFVKYLNQIKKQPDIIYTDHDLYEINNKNEIQFYNPFFKPDWSEQMFYGFDYIHNLVFFHKNSLIDMQIGMFQKWFLTYQIILENIYYKKNTVHIYHIPMVLYNQHYDNFYYKNQKLNIKTKLLKEQFEDDIYIKHIYRDKFIDKIVYKYDKYKVSIIIPTKNKSDLLINCVDSILQKTKYDNYEIIIIDNNSSEDACLNYYKDIALKYNNIKILYYKLQFNFSNIINYGVQHSNGEFVCLLNNDTEIITSDWIEQMLQYAQIDNIGAVGCKLLFSDKETIQHSGVVLGLWHGADHFLAKVKYDKINYMFKGNIAQEVSAVTGACMMISKTKYLSVNGFDNHYQIDFSDVDFCLKLMQKGYKNIYTPHAILIHHESQSKKTDNNFYKISQKDINLLRKKWTDIIENDPYFNVNFSKYKKYFALNNKPYVV